MRVFAWAVTVLVAGLVLAFAGYLVSLRRLPAAGRTTVRVFDRFGQVKEATGCEQPRQK